MHSPLNVRFNFQLDRITSEALVIASAVSHWIWESFVCRYWLY